MIEINEPAHYFSEIYNKRFKRFKNKKKYDFEFEHYVNNFNKKVELAKENNIELIIIDVDYDMNWKDLVKLYEERLLPLALPYLLQRQ